MVSSFTITMNNVIVAQLSERPLFPLSSTYDVDIDPRGQDIAATNLRSINLAISSRGIEALRSVDPSLGESSPPAL